MLTREELIELIGYNSKGVLVWKVDHSPRTPVGSFVSKRGAKIDGVRYSYNELKTLIDKHIPDVVVEEIVPEPVPEPEPVHEIIPEPVPEPEPVIVPELESEPVPEPAVGVQDDELHGEAYLPEDIRLENGLYNVYVHDSFYGTFKYLRDAEVLAIKIRQRIKRR
jgi:hypothetical protein